MMLAGVTIYVSITRVTYVLQVLLPLPFRLPLFLLLPFPLPFPLFILLLLSFHLALPLLASVSPISFAHFFPFPTSQSFAYSLSCPCPLTCPTYFPVPVPLLQLFLPLIISMLSPLIQQSPIPLFTKNLMSLLTPACPFLSGQYSPCPKLCYTRPNSHVQ